MAGGHVVAFVAVHVIEDVVVEHAAALVLLARGQAGAGGSAEGRRADGPGEADAAGSQPLQVGAAHRDVRVRREPVGALLVGEDEEDVGPLAHGLQAGLKDSVDRRRLRLSI